MQDWPKAPVPRSLTTWTLRRVVVWSIYDQRIYQFHTRTCSRLMQFAGYINLNHVSSRIWIVFQVITTNNIAASLFIVFHQWSIAGGVWWDTLYKVDARIQRVSAALWCLHLEVSWPECISVCPTCSCVTHGQAVAAGSRLLADYCSVRQPS